MIYDSEQQKNFILEAVKKYPCTYESALQLANTFGQAIQDGRIVGVKQQLEAMPLPKQKAAPGDGSKPGANGNRKARRAEKAGKAAN